VPRRVLALVLVVLAAAALGALVTGGDEPARPSAVVPRDAPDRIPREPAQRPPDPYARIQDPFAWDPDREQEFVDRAASGLSYPLYAQVPGGAVASAARTARWREEVERVADDADVDADTLEAMVYLESAGNPEARAPGGTGAATGLTQILGETGRTLLGMRVDEVRSRRLTRRIARAERRGQAARAERLRAERRRVDERYDPRKALEGAGRYLEIAREALGGREDLAVVSYHMGIGNLQSVLRRFGAQEDTSYAEVFFDSSPLRHRAAWDLLASFGDDSPTYLWRVEAAKDVMARWRDDPQALAEHAARVTAKNSREEALHPVERTTRFRDRDDLERAYREGDLLPLDVEELAGAGVRVSRQMGELARRIGRPRRLYRGLRPEAYALLVHLARGVEAISGRAPIVVTSTVRDQAYQRLLLRGNVQATAGYSLHTTGWAFDVLRRYRSRRQALAFQFLLDRFAALDLIAWVREPAAIHITVSPQARALLPLLRGQGEEDDDDQ